MRLVVIEADLRVHLLHLSEVLLELLDLEIHGFFLLDCSLLAAFQSSKAV